MKRKRLLTLIGSICLILVLAALLLPACAKEEAPVTPTPAAEVINWKFQSNVNVDAPTYIADAWWVKWVEEGSNGRLKITMYPAGQIVKSPDYFDALADNVVQMAVTYGGYYKGWLPEAGLACGFPMVFKNINDVNYMWYDLGINDLIREAYAEHGVYHFCSSSYGQVPIWAKQPVRTLDDFDGLKIRAVGELAEILAGMGAACTFLPHEESYTALQLGTIDAYSCGLGFWPSFKHTEICPYVMQPAALPVGVDGRSISMKALEELPEDLSAFIKSQEPVLNWMLSRTCESLDADILCHMDEYGGEIVQFDDEVVKMMTEGGVAFLDEYAEKSDRCAKMVGIIKGFMKDRGYID